MRIHNVKSESAEEPSDNDVVFEQVSRRESVFHGPYLHRVPDIITLPKYIAYHLLPGLIFGDVVERKVITRLEVAHRMTGVYEFWVAPTRKNDISPAHILDLAPTILHLMGLNVPSEMDGNVLENLLV